ncbi:MAG: cytochrome P450 [Pseudonocardiales bacterium]|nr:cytochrome P450 [Pseudonocardiales bacterium]
MTSTPQSRAPSTRPAGDPATDPGTGEGAAAGGHAPARASARDTARVLGGVLGPMLAQGVIARRPRMTALAQRRHLDDRADAILRRMRERYGAGPLRLRVPGRSVALLLDPDDVHRVLRDSPEPFAADTREKRGALGHFQPHGVLVSHGAVREERRRFAEAVLDTGHPVHRLAGTIGVTAREEAARCADLARVTGTLDWPAFAAAWRPMVRRIVLGDAAREDREVSDLLTALRGRANWSYLATRRPDRLRRLRRRLGAYVDAAEPGSLAGLVAAVPAPDRADRVDQIPQWLFAFDPAGMATFRALALLVAHPDVLARVPGDDGTLLRGAVLESVRLWPTTAVVLRDTTAPTRWGGATLPAGTALGVVSSFFHRDPATVPGADRFDPDRWSDGRADDGRTLLPFSAGPVVCPGRELVLLVAAEFLRALLGRATPALTDGPLDAARPLPHGLDPFGLRFAVPPDRPGDGRG